MSDPQLSFVSARKITGKEEEKQTAHPKHKKKHKTRSSATADKPPDTSESPLHADVKVSSTQNATKHSFHAMRKLLARARLLLTRLTPSMRGIPSGKPEWLGYNLVKVAR